MPSEAPLPNHWEARRGRDSGETYYYNVLTEESTLRRPEVLTKGEWERAVTRAGEETAAFLAARRLLRREERAEIGDFLVDTFAGSDSLDTFLTSVGDDAGISVTDLTAVYHFIHMAYPNKKANFKSSRAFRENAFNPTPPLGWEVRESSSKLGNFYYINTATGETCSKIPEKEKTNERTTDVSEKRWLQKQEVTLVTDVGVLEDTTPRFLRSVFSPAALGENIGCSTRLVKNPQGELSKAAALPSALLEMRRKMNQKGRSFESTWTSSSPSLRNSRRPTTPSTLPIAVHKEDIMHAIHSSPSRCLIVIGETGSGKTTQIPQYVMELNDRRGVGGIVACTQPRRVSAMSIAKRVAEECRVRVGEEVGYSVRFDERTSQSTRIKYMTEGMLLREVIHNPFLNGYSCVMVDEAHERTVTSDLLLHLLKKILVQNPYLTLLISSATIDAKKFSEYFFDSSVFYIPGRTHPVETFYVNESEDDWYAMVLKVVFEIHCNEGDGDILVFLTGQDEIDTAAEVCFEWYQKLLREQPTVQKMVILPLYSSLASENQAEIFLPAPRGHRKVIFSTNIAETSVTIDGVVFVVDCGFAKTKTYDPGHKMDCLITTPISQAAARQRAGRAGRTCPGKCFRLYTEQSYEEEMMGQTIPEIQRTNLETTLLMLKDFFTKLPKGDDVTFAQFGVEAFLDPPPAMLVSLGLYNLYHLGALDEEGGLTEKGALLLKFPVEVHLACLLLSCKARGCIEDGCGVVGWLTCGSNMWARIDDNRPLQDPKGDHTVLAILSQKIRENPREITQICQTYGVSVKAADSAMKIAKQLHASVSKMELSKTLTADDNATGDPLLRAVCEASILRVARRFATENNVVMYRTLQDEMVATVHPSSVFSRLSWDESPEWVVFNELVQTRREYLRTVSSVEPDWLAKAGPHLFVSISTQYRGQQALDMRKEMSALRSGFSGDSLRGPPPQREDDRGGYGKGGGDYKRRRVGGGGGGRRNGGGR